MTTNSHTQVFARREAWIGLTLVPGWGSVKIWRAVGKPPQPIPAWQGQHNQGLMTELQRVLSLAKNNNVTTLTWDDDNYPANLREVENPPPVVFVQGTILPADMAAVAIVGSRRASPHALQASFSLARDLATCGVTIVSGLATGIDAAAHRGALAAGGRTIAVVASGLDTVYPAAHRDLATSIKHSGAMLSQFPCGTPAERSHFPIRNRTMAGLALGTVVVEAPERSGSLITAGFAGDMGRDVMACPGDVFREHTRGSNLLLRDGARVVLDAADILTEISAPLRRILNALGSDAPYMHSIQSSPTLPFDDAAVISSKTEYLSPPVHTEVWNALLIQSCSADNLAERINWAIPAVNSALTELELLGFVRREYGNMYSIVKNNTK